MTKVSDIVEKIRSKNAGPFWLTIDIFCDDRQAFEKVSSHLKTEVVANLYAVETADIKRFDIADLNVVKFSFPRPVVQGSVSDRDMHGASYGLLLRYIELPI